MYLLALYNLLNNGSIVEEYDMCQNFFLKWLKVQMKFEVGIGDLSYTFFQWFEYDLWFGFSILTKLFDKTIR